MRRSGSAVRKRPTVRETHGRAVFIDTSYLLAIVDAQDALHARALALSERLAKQKAALRTTHAVLLEVGNTLSKPHLRPFAARILDGVANDPAVSITPVAAVLYARALALFRERPDQAWSLTDCLSFVVMRDGGLMSALTYDKHFEQAGFRALLRDTELRAV
jgi:predicted nucleic acid-binding protein